jgi:hypothetical protein
MWTYKGTKIDSHADLHPDCTDFVYMITFEGGSKYIGKKAVRAVRKCPPLKGKVRCRRLLKNLPFIKYQGSFEHSENMTPIQKDILYQCKSRKTSTYLEMITLVNTDAIFKTSYINQNISGTFFNNSLDGLIL